VLKERGDWVENVELIKASDYASVPEMARTRLGMSPGQQNYFALSGWQHLEGGCQPVYDLVCLRLVDDIGHAAVGTMAAE
jgi:hypothetical protein